MTGESLVCGRNKHLFAPQAILERHELWVIPRIFFRVGGGGGGAHVLACQEWSPPPFPPPGRTSVSLDWQCPCGVALQIVTITSFSTSLQFAVLPNQTRKENSPLPAQNQDFFWQFFNVEHKRPFCRPNFLGGALGAGGAHAH